MTGMWWWTADLQTGQPVSLAEQTEAMAGAWTPCHHPERPFDRSMALHDACPRCLLALEAAELRGEVHTYGNDLPLLPLMRARLAEYGPAPEIAHHGAGEGVGCTSGPCPLGVTRNDPPEGAAATVEVGTSSVATTVAGDARGTG